MQDNLDPVKALQDLPWWIWVFVIILLILAVLISPWILTAIIISPLDDIIIIVLIILLIRHLHIHVIKGGK